MPPPRRAMPRHGDVGHRFAWASVSKPASAVAMLVAAEEGLVDLDEPAGPPGATFRHLLAHTSGLPFDPGPPVARPGTRRIYSNAGFDAAAELVAARAEMPFAEYFHTVWEGTGITLDGPASAGAHGTIEDLVALARELQRAGAARSGDARRGDDGAVPRARRRAPGLRAPDAERLGSRLRSSRLEGAALDGIAELAADVRAFRAKRHVRLGRSGAGCMALRADGSRLRTRGPRRRGRGFRTT